MEGDNRMKQSIIFIVLLLDSTILAFSQNQNNNHNSRLFMLSKLKTFFTQSLSTFRT